MYVTDLAEYARVLLATTEMSFVIGWLRVQLILFCQLAGITGNRPEALVELRYRHLQLTLIRDPTADRPRLFIELTPEFTKSYLGLKDMFVLSSLAYIALSYSTLLTKLKAYISTPRNYLRPDPCAQPSCLLIRHAIQDTSLQGYDY